MFRQLRGRSLMTEPIDIRTRRPIRRKRQLSSTEKKSEELLTAQELAEVRRGLEASRTDAQFAETSQRIRADLARLKPDILAQTLSRSSRKNAALLIGEARAWIDAFEQALEGETVRAV
jgi:hypothetical protein